MNTVLKYHDCCRENKCVGLKKGIKGYHSCCRENKCKKKERLQVNKVKKNLKQLIQNFKTKQLVKNNKR